jgi:hypothetical protein
VQQERLERGMSPVVMDNSISVVGADATSTSMPVSLASTAEHVAQQLQLLQQSMSVLADIAERQSSAVSNCNGIILLRGKAHQHRTTGKRIGKSSFDLVHD